eukprot:gb/GFBE01025147.1/.p1 GENE.gb/GFBE01025147.1/~~gb/GFBE01025147.1/.p1  ORF type:complete len:220 (+),score=30.99 gb/GFBE01025147.1/:1-660(+)
MASKKESLLDRSLDDLVESRGGRDKGRSDRRPPRDEPRERRRPRDFDDESRGGKGRGRGDRHTDRGDRGDRGDRDGERDRKHKAQKRPRSESPEVVRRLGRGGRMIEKRMSAEVKKAKGRGDRTRGTLGSRPTTIMISNIAPVVDWDMLKELFQGAAGKIKDGRLEDDGTAIITFEKPNAASLAHSEFNGGELADKKIKVELLYDDESSDSEDGWTRVK